MRASLIAVLLCACTRVDTASAPDPTRESPVPQLHVEPPAQVADFTGPPALLRCPDSHEHGCTAVFRVPHAGGEAQLFTLENGIPNDMAVADDELLYASQVSFSTLVAYPKRASEPAGRREALRLLDASGSRVQRISLAGEVIVVALEQGVIAAPLDGSPRTVLSTTSAAFFVQTDGRSAVWSEDPGGRIMQSSISGGTPRVVVEGEDSPQDVTVDASGIYWINWGNGYFDPPGQVRALTSDDTRPRTLAKHQVAPRVITSDSDALYWVVDGPEGRALRKVDKRGGEVVELVARTGREGHRGNEDVVVRFGAHVYFNAGDAVWRVGVDGEGPTEVAMIEDQNADVATFAVDESGIYVAARIYDPHELESELE